MRILLTLRLLSPVRLILLPFSNKHFFSRLGLGNWYLTLFLMMFDSPSAQGDYDPLTQMANLTMTLEPDWFMSYVWVA